MPKHGNDGFEHLNCGSEHLTGNDGSERLTGKEGSKHLNRDH